MTFRAQSRDVLFAMKAVGLDGLLTAHFPDLDEDIVTAVLEAAGQFAQNELAPLNRAGDTVGARLEQGRVIAAPGFADAYRAFAGQGWNSLSADPDHGGQGLPKVVELAVFEMVHAANMAFGLCPMLTQGAIEALSQHGAERQKTLVLPKLVSGEWTGTMNLTEPQAGSDLSALTTRAEPDGEGGYRLTGQKIFITWGDHDVAENICHLVLARLPDAPPGTEGVSLFLAPKRLIRDDGGLGVSNDLKCGSIEHKLGIHGSPTCVMLFEGARAELVGQPNKGVSQMFTMMNAARLQVGVQGVAIAERAFQQALAFAQERRQGRALWSDASPAAIWDHPDVRRTLLLMKARIEAARGICLLTGLLADLARLANTAEARAAAQARQELLTPIAKAWSTDMGVDVASMAVQVHGGMGFIEETGAAQHYRDARIAPIYEGTNGIQAADLAGRKLRTDNGATMDALCVDMSATIDAFIARFGPVRPAERMAAGIAALRCATALMLSYGRPEAMAMSAPYLILAGDIVGGWILCRNAMAPSDATVATTKMALFDIYCSQIVALAPGRADGMGDGAGQWSMVTPDMLTL